MADMLISPEGYTTPGAVPRKLLAGVLIVITAVAMGVFLLTSPDDPPMTGDQKARAALQAPDALKTQATSNALWVDEAVAAATPASSPSAPRANDSGLSREAVARLPDMRTVGLPADAANAAATRRLPAFDGPGSPGDGAPAGPDAGAIERERTARTAATTVFDDAGTPSVAAARPAALLPDDMSRAMGGTDQLAPVIQAIKAGQGTAAVATAPAEDARRWARELGAAGGDGVLRHRPAAAEWMLHQGTVIPCVLTRRINSDLPGVVTARVSMDVYDSRTSRRLLLPKGSLLSGAYNNDVKSGQSRLQFAFTRLRLPDGSTFELPGATGSDAAGQAGIDGDVDRHFFRSFGAALLLGVLADQVTRVAALPNGGANGQGGVSATGQVFIDTARAELERHKAIPPTVTVAEGSRIHVEVVRDMVFDGTPREGT